LNSNNYLTIKKSNCLSRRVPLLGQILSGNPEKQGDYHDLRLPLSKKNIDFAVFISKTRIYIKSDSALAFKDNNKEIKELQ